MLKFSHSALKLSYAHLSIVFSLINITSSNIASKAKRNQIVDLKTAGISNCNITNQLDVYRKTVTIYRDY